MLVPYLVALVCTWWFVRRSRITLIQAESSFALRAFCDALFRKELADDTPEDDRKALASFRRTLEPQLQGFFQQRPPTSWILFPKLRAHNSVVSSPLPAFADQEVRRIFREFLSRVTPISFRLFPHRRDLFVNTLLRPTA